MDNLQWFKFSPSDWMMGRIQRQPAQVQVDFIRLCCKYWQKECNLTVDDAMMEAVDSYDVLLKYRIIAEVDGCVRIAFLDEQMEGVNTKRRQASQAGKRSAEARMRSTESNDRSTTVQRNPTEKSREEENREEESREEEIKKTEKALPPTPSHPLITWMEQNTPRIQKLSKPLTNEEAAAIVAMIDHSRQEEFRKMLLAMENYKPLLSKNTSANLTIRNWWARQSKTEPTEGQKIVLNLQKFTK